MSILVLTILVITTKNQNPVKIIPEDQSQQSLVQIVKNYNQKCLEIKGIKYARIKFLFTNNAVFFYTKPNTIFFESKGLLRKEMVVATNDNVFWFWMRSFDANSAYYCPVNALENTRVIPLLRPSFIIGMLGVEEIKPTAYAFENGLLIVKADSRNIYFDQEKIVKQEYFDSQGLYASIEVIKFHKIGDLFLPKEVRAKLHRDDQQITISLEEPEINGEWEFNTEVPPGLKKINLENY